MNMEIMNLLGNVQKKMNGYAILMNFRFMNLCTKAEPSALLPVTVSIDNEDLDIELVAQAAVPQDDRFLIIPKEQRYLFAICKGIAKSHPEFRIDRIPAPKEDEDGREADDEDRDGEEEQWILCTVPEVNKDRHDLIMEGIKLLSDETKGKIDKAFSVAGVRIAKVTMGMSPENIEEVKQNLQETYDWHNDLCKQYREKKEKEVEDAYQRYLQKQDAEETARKEEEDARGEKVGFRMKLNGEEQ